MVIKDGNLVGLNSILNGGKFVFQLCLCIVPLKGKGSPYSITERRVLELIRFLAVSLQVM